MARPNGGLWRTQIMKRPIGVRIDEILIKALDSQIDGLKYVSRAHLLTVIIDKWIAEEHQKKLTEARDRMRGEA